MKRNLIFKEEIVHSVLAVEDGVAVHPLLLQALIPLQKRAIQNVRHIEEHQIVGNGHGILGRDLIADNKFVVDQTAEFWGIIAADGNDGNALVPANTDRLIQVLDQQGRGDHDHQIVPANIAGDHAHVVQIRDRLGIKAHHAELKFQLPGHKAGVGEAKDKNMPSLLHRGGRVKYLILIQHGGGIDQHMPVILADGGQEIGLHLRLILKHIIIEILLRQSHLKAIKTLKTDLFAKPVDAGLRGVRIVRDRGNGAGHDLIRVVDHILGDPILANSQAGLHGDDFRNNGRNQGATSFKEIFINIPQTLQKVKRWNFFGITVDLCKTDKSKTFKLCKNNFH